jgi:hypothetical protein
LGEVGRFETIDGWARLRILRLVGGDGEVEGYGLGELDAGGGAGGDLILIGSGWRDADVGVASAAAAGRPEGGEGE